MRQELLRLLVIAEAPNIAHTKTSRDSDKLIDQFQNRLAAFTWLMGQRRITEDDKKRLFVIFYKYTERQYFLGQEYADRASGDRKPVSKGDLERIDQLAKQALKDFWNSLRKQGITHDFDNHISFHDIDRLLQTHDDFDEVVQQVWDKKQEAFPIFSLQLNNVLANMTNLFASDTGIKALNQGTISNAQVLTWITRVDQKVCPICMPLHGKTWRKDDPNLLTPVADSHPNCRCRLLLPTGEPEI